MNIMTTIGNFPIYSARSPENNHNINKILEYYFLPGGFQQLPVGEELSGVVSLSTNNILLSLNESSKEYFYVELPEN